MSRPPFRLKSTIGRRFSVHPDDVRNAKRALVDLGHMRVPDYGLTPYPDEPLFVAIESFQRENSLQDDGVIEPEGPTLRNLNRSLAVGSRDSQQRKRQQAATAPEATSVASPTVRSAVEQNAGLIAKPRREAKLADLLQQLPNDLDEDVLELALLQRSSNQAGLSDHGKDLCDKRLESELRACARLPGQWHGPCAQRAFIRWGLCYRYGYPPGPEKEPPEWGPGDME